MYGPQKVDTGDDFLLRLTKNTGGQRNPFSTIGFNGESTTNLRSSSAMRGAEFHGNSGCDRLPQPYEIGA